MKKIASRPAVAEARPHRRSLGFSLRRTRVLAAIVGALAFFAAAPASAQAQALQLNESEREMFELLNRERVAHNLPELRWDDALFKAARQHALRMLDLNAMEHQLPGEQGLEERLAAAGARFTYIAENIAIGKNASTIHSGWMNSHGHRANILNARVTAAGIAVVHGTAGLFAVEDFSQSFGDITLEQQEKQVASMLSAKGLRVTGTADDARKACDKKGYVGSPGTRSGSVIRFETPDLSEFSPELEKKIQHEPYHNVAVGACRTSEAAGFGRYRIALLFF